MTKECRKNVIFSSLGTPDRYLLFESPRPLSPPRVPQTSYQPAQELTRSRAFAHHSVKQQEEELTTDTSFCDSGSVPKASHLPICSIFMTTISDWCYCYPHFTDEETETQRQSHPPMPQYPYVRLECFSFLLQVSCTPWGAECLSLTMFHGTYAIIALWSCRHGNSQKSRCIYLLQLFSAKASCYSALCSCLTHTQYSINFS